MLELKTISQGYDDTGNTMGDKCAPALFQGNPVCAIAVTGEEGILDTLSIGFHDRPGLLYDNESKAFWYHLARTDNENDVKAAVSEIYRRYAIAGIGHSAVKDSWHDDKEFTRFIAPAFRKGTRFIMLLAPKDVKDDPLATNEMRHPVDKKKEAALRRNAARAATHAAQAAGDTMQVSGNGGTDGIQEG